MEVMLINVFVKILAIKISQTIIFMSMSTYLNVISYTTVFVKNNDLPNIMQSKVYIGEKMDILEKCISTQWHTSLHRLG